MTNLSQRTETGTSAPVVIAAEAPRQNAVFEMLDLGRQYAEGLYPPESNFLLDIDELEKPGVIVYLARDADGSALGMAASVLFSDGVTELKRMFVRPEARGRGVAKALLAQLEADAVAAGIVQVVLETGDLHDEAQALYRRCGYEEIPQFGPYIGEKHSVCMAKRLPRAGA